MATSIKFQQNLDDLKERLLIMAGMAEQAIQRSIEAYRTRDLSICELVFQSEPLINRLEREIDQMALDLLAMEQPMAIDLRFILSVIRINADLERVGDQAVNIAVRVREMGAFANIDLPVDIPKLASLASAMVRKALQAFIEGDADLAQSVLVSHLDMIAAALDCLGIPHENGFFAKDIDPKPYFTEGWEERVFGQLKGAYSETILIFYINHLRWELLGAESIYQPVAV